jgi:hypothetical protein
LGEGEEDAVQGRSQVFSRPSRAFSPLSKCREALRLLPQDRIVGTTMAEAEAHYKPFCTDVADAIFSSTRWEFKFVVVNACCRVPRPDSVRSYKTVKRTVNTGRAFCYYCSEDEATQVRGSERKTSRRTRARSYATHSLPLPFLPLLQCQCSCS